MKVAATAPKRPILRYHGGKFRLARWIIRFFPEHRVYVEPFGGAGSVLMQKPRAHSEIIGDLDGEVVNVFRVLRDPTQGRELKRLLELTPYARAEYEMAFVPASDPIEQARRTIVRSYVTVGSDGVTAPWASGFRAKTNKDHGTSSSRDWQNYPNALDAMIERLRGVVIENRPALDLIARYFEPFTLIYCDPPYPHTTRPGAKKPKHGYRFEMLEEDHRELAGTLRASTAMVVLSGYGCELYDELYHDWHRQQKSTVADNAQPRTEMLWMNDAAHDALMRERAQIGLSFEPLRDSVSQMRTEIAPLKLEKVKPTEDAILEMVRSHYSYRDNVKKRPRTTKTSKTWWSNAKLAVFSDVERTFVFAWQWPKAEYRSDKQVGFNNTLFHRSDRCPYLASDIILAAEKAAVEFWGAQRAYTYVDPEGVKSTNPGFCYKMAGWKFVKVADSGKLLFEKMLYAT